MAREPLLEHVLFHYELLLTLQKLGEVQVVLLGAVEQLLEISVYYLICKVLVLVVHFLIGHTTLSLFALVEDLTQRLSHVEIFLIVQLALGPVVALLHFGHHF